MIQSAAPNSASAPSQVSGLLSGQPAENGEPGTESGAFASILADRDGSAAAPSASPTASATPAEPAPAAIDEGGTLAAAQPNLAAPLPLTGKILPGLLPDAASTGPATTEPAGETADKTAAGQTVPALLAALRALRTPQAEAPAARPAMRAGQPIAAAEPDAEDGAADPAGPAAVLFTTQAGLALSVSAADGAPTPGTAPGTTGLPPLIEAQLLGRPLAVRDGAPAAAPAAEAGPAKANDDALALQLDPARIDRGAAAGIQFEAGAARPMSGVRLRPELAAAAEDRLTAAAAATTDFATNPGGAPTTPLAQPAGAPAPIAPQGLPQTAHPRDFAALMDRLIAARDAAQTGLPQSVQVAVNHAEFGQVSLSFQHDQRGLAVSVASADPDFARAVQAAIPAMTGASGADAGARDSGANPGGQGWTGPNLGRGDASAAGGDAGQRQGRTARFDPDLPAPAASRGAEARDPTPSQPRGIFA